ncbi:flagellar filament capping protein FliD [Sedimentibacter sp.]|uniref:flagellar filament capping protein FliD n=1 Tax=Sedimentibacter sp. TaxID=1960295 RepID=UPI00289B1AC7|nr:flagellar filament capping protein FliD [Sedimentibacter sp.]
MASISNSLYGSTINKGFGGLMSGLDTDELVKQMTAATRNKINRQYQSKQKLLYRQEAYREISSKLLAFSDKYFSFAAGSKTNILSASFFEAYTVKPSSNYVNVTGNADNIKNFSINSITSVASAARYTTENIASSQSFSSGKVYSEMASLAGDTMTIEHDGKRYNLQFSKDFRFTGSTIDDHAEEIAAELNKQLDSLKDKNGNKLSDSIKYEAVNGEIMFETGEAKLVAASKDILKAFSIDKIEKDTIASSNGAIEAEGLIRTAEEVFLESSITFDFNGIKKTIDLSKMAEDTIKYTYDTAGLKEYLSDELAKAYGSGKVKVEIDPSNPSSDSLIFSAVNSDTDVFGVSNISGDLSIITGIKAGDNNRLSMSKSIGSIYGENTDFSLEINEKPIEITSSMTVNDIIKKINAESDVNITYSTITDKFTINSKETGKHSEINISGGLANILFKEEISGPKGTDTVMSYTLNGQPVTINRSTANFTIDGINVELNKNSEGFKATDPSEPPDPNASTIPPITFDVINNVDEVVEKVKKFIDDYNEIITLIGTKTKEKPSSKYPPLTPEQQEEMTEKEIENWNKEAQKGSLFGDSKMTTLLSNLRTGIMGKTDVSDLVLANIGISPAFMDTSGKLVLDEQKFKEKLMENPDEIASLFTGTRDDEGSKQGLAIQIRDILRKNIGVSGTSGILIEEAGLDGGLTSDKNNISKKIKDHDDRMEALKRALEVERQRYWNQFTALEKALSNLNAQSSWLTDMMG